MVIKKFLPRVFVLTLLSLLWTGTTWARGELSFYIGPSIDQTGNVQDLGEPEANVGFEFNYFFNQTHGMGFSFGNEYDFEGTKKIPWLRDASIQTFDVHYALNIRPQNSKIRFQFTPGFGIQTLYDQSTDYYWGYWYYNSLSTAWVFSYKLMMDFILKESSPEEGGSNIFIGFGINHMYSFDDDYAGHDISGGRLSGIFRFGFGF
jgi:hypothetical protein